MTHGLENREVDEASAGDIVWLAGPDDITLGDTLASPELEAADAALPPLEIEEPTVSMFFLVNNGPFAGQDGRPATLRQIKDRLERELRVNVALRVEDLGRPDGVKVCGRGELHLAILIEEMRREGLELCVSRPEVITRRDSKGKLLEPMEQLIIDVPDEYQGTVIQELSLRKGELVGVEATGTGLVRLEFTISTRGLIGYRNDFLTETRGLGVMSSRFTGYGPWKGDLPGRERGSLVSQTGGEAAGYSLENLQNRAVLFVGNMTPVYEGMIVGENSRSDDMLCNPTKRKALGNYRQSTKEIDTGLKVPREITLESALEWIADDELVEVTPKIVRVRKHILSTEQRKKFEKRGADALRPRPRAGTRRGPGRGGTPYHGRDSHPPRLRGRLRGWRSSYGRSQPHLVPRQTHRRATGAGATVDQFLDTDGAQLPDEERIKDDGGFRGGIGGLPARHHRPA